MAKKLTPDVITWSLKINGSDAQKEMRNLQDSSKELKKQQDALRKSMTDLAAQGRKGSEEWKRLDTALKENRKELETNRQKMEALTQRMNLNEMTAGQLEKRLKTLKKELKDTSRATEPERWKALTAEIKRTEQAMHGASGSTGLFAGALQKIGGLRTAVMGFFGGLAVAAGAALVGAFKQAIDKIIEFEKANSVLAAILGTTKDGIADLTAEARRLGATTAYTASQVTSLQTELAKLGFGKQSIKEMTPSVLKFATAVGTDLASAAAFAGSTLRIFELDANQAERALAATAVGCTKSALSFSYLQSAMSTVGPVANAFGFSLEETVSLLGALSNAGFEASSAATATRNILLNLANANGKLAQALGKPVTDIYELVDGLQKLNEEGIDLAKTLELTDKRSVAAFNTFLKGGKTILELNRSVTGAEDAFNAMADEMANNVSGSLKSLSSAWEGLMLNFYESRGIMKSIIDGLTGIVKWMGNLFGISTKVKATIEAQADVEERLAKASHDNIDPLRRLIKAVNDGKETIDKLREASGLYNIELDREGRLTKDSTKAINEKISALERENKASHDNIDLLRRLIKAVNDGKEPIDKLREATGLYNIELDREGRLTKDSTKAITEKISALERENKAKVIRQKLDELYAKRLEQERAVNEARSRANAYKPGHVIPSGGAAPAYMPVNTAGQDLKKAQEAVEGTVAAIEQLESELHALTEETNAAGTAGTNAAGAANEQLDIEMMNIEQLKKHIKELKKLRDAETDSTKLARFNAQIQEATERLRLLTGGTTQAMKDAKAEAREAERAAKESDRELTHELKKGYDERLKMAEDAADRQADIIRRSSASQVAKQVEMQAVETAVAQERVRLARENLDNIEAAEWKTDEARVKAVKEAAAQILTESRHLAAERLKLTAQLSRMADEKTGLEGLQARYERQIQEVKAAYDAIIALAEQNKLDTTNLKAQENAELEQLNYDYLQKLFQLQQQVGTTWQEQFDNELRQLKHLKNQELITEQQYQRKKKQLQVQYAAQYAQYYSQLMTDLVSSLSNYEIAQSDAKYDVLIQQAQNEGRETEQLETEKANAKLKIQKKYALAEFLVKTSQIIADTSVAIMMAYAQLGPIAGNIAAAMIGVTGLMQQATAWKEYQRIKSLPESVSSSSSSSSSPATATRALKNGFSQGGPTGSGGTLEVAGVVHRNEYVVPQFLMQDAFVLDAIGNIEALRQQHLHGYAKGGPTSPQAQAQPTPSSQPSLAALSQATRDLAQAARSIERIRAYVVLTDLEDKQRTLDNARNYFTRR